MFNIDENIQKKLSNISFVESVSTDIETQNVLLEAIESTKKEGRFNSAKDMFTYIEKEWGEE